MTKSLWKQRNFMLLWSGQLASWMGTEVTGIALPLVVLALTGSPGQAGIVAAIRGIVYVIWSIPAGALLDRWDRKAVMVVSNLGSGLAMGSISLALALHELTLIQLCLACAVEGSFFVFANLGRFASLPRVVSREQFPAASAQLETADHNAILTGPPLGGFLYQAAGGFATFLADALSYIINALTVLLIAVPLSMERPDEYTTIRHDIREAVSWYRKQPILRFLNLITAGRVAVMSGLYLLIILLAREHNASAIAIGLIFAVAALGGILGSLVAGRVHGRFGLRQILLGVNLVSLLIVTLYAFAGDVYTLAAITALFYAVDPVHQVATASYSAAAIPDAIRGRVVSLTRLQVLGANSFGLFAAGVTSQYLGSNWTIGLFALVLLAMVVGVATDIPRIPQS